MSMPIDLLEKRQKVVVRARADLIGHLAYINITDIFDFEDEDLLYEVLTNQNAKKRMLDNMSRDDLLSHCLSTAVAHAARILAPEDFRELVTECTKIACGASSECYSVDQDVLTLLIYEDAQKHALTEELAEEISKEDYPWWDENDSIFSANSECYSVDQDMLTFTEELAEEISKECCPWWDENDSIFSANETAKIISGAAQTNVIASPRESASVVPHRQTGGSDSSGGDGDGEPPRPRRSSHSPTPPLHHSLTHSLTIAGGAQ